MLKLKLLHPGILHTLAMNGHGSKVLIADGNYPLNTCTPPTCRKVYLNLSPGLLMVTDVLKVIKDIIPVESGIIMNPPDESDQPVHHEFQEILGPQVRLDRKKRFDFYFEAKSEDTCLAIATGETRRFA